MATAKLSRHGFWKGWWCAVAWLSRRIASVVLAVYSADLSGAGDRCSEDCSMSELSYMAFMVVPRVS